MDKHWSRPTQVFLFFSSLQTGFFGFFLKHSPLVRQRSTFNCCKARTQDLIVPVASDLHISPASVSQSESVLHCSSSLHRCSSSQTSSKSHLDRQSSGLTQILFPSASLQTDLSPWQSRFFVHWSLFGGGDQGLETQTLSPLGVNFEHCSSVSQSKSEVHRSGSLQTPFESSYSFKRKRLSDKKPQEEAVPPLEHTSFFPPSPYKEFLGLFARSPSLIHTRLGLEEKHLVF